MTTRMEAARKQFATYLGAPCKHGHRDGKRYTSTGTCVACVAASSKARNATIRSLLKGEPK